MYIYIYIYIYITYCSHGLCGAACKAAVSVLIHIWPGLGRSHNQIRVNSKGRHLFR